MPSSSAPVPSGESSSMNRTSKSMFSRRIASTMTGAFSRSLYVGMTTSVASDAASPLAGSGWSISCGRRLRLDDGNLGQRKDQLASAAQVRGLSLDEILPKMPGHHEKVVRIARVCLRLGDDRNVGSRRIRAELVGIHLGHGR